MSVAQLARGRRYLARYYDQPVPVGAPLESFDPSEHTVAEVEAYLDEHPSERQRLLDAELDGKQRVTLIDALTPEPEPDDEDESDEDEDESETEPE